MRSQPQDFRRRRLRRLVRRYKVFVGCAECGYNRRAEALQYHHRPGTEKLFEIGKGSQRNGIDKVRAEIRKCVVLCANCHHEHHADAPTL